MATTTRDRTAKGELTPMERVALTRLRRFTRVAAVAEASDSPIWQRLARVSAQGAYRDCLLLGLGAEAEAIIAAAESARAA